MSNPINNRRRKRAGLDGVFKALLPDLQTQIFCRIKPGEEPAERGENGAEAEETEVTAA